MKQTDQTLLEQMRITEFEVINRKNLFCFTEEDAELLRSCKSFIEDKIDILVAEFYQMQTEVAEIALVIGDADTLIRLQRAQHKYILDLFSGVYDLEYVNNRLRIGLVHKRIGVEPKLYLAAIHTLKTILKREIQTIEPDVKRHQTIIESLSKLFLFDITLVFETYVRSMVSEIEIAKEKSEQYARGMEQKVLERTKQLEDLARTDFLTGLRNVRYLDEATTTAIRIARRRSEPLTVVFLDVNDLKLINDTQGHQYGDDVLRAVGSAIKHSIRPEDSGFRYGGDEFCVILPNCTEEQAQSFVQRFLSAVEEKKPGLSISVGAAQTGPTDYVDADLLIQVADERMYIAKQGYKKSK